MTDNREMLDPQTVREELTRLAEVAAAMLDGEEVKAIITQQAMRRIADPDPEFRYMSGDYYDVDHELFLRTKKFLIRLERLGKIKCNGSVWVPVPGRDEVTVAVQNGAHHRYYQFGQERLATPPEMKEVFRTAQVAAAPDRDPSRPGDLITALAPVRDSLGEVVAVVELTAPLDVHAPAWS